MRLRTIGLISSLVLGLLAAPLPTDAQKAGKMPRVGYLSYGRKSPALNPFRQGLRELGYVDGQNIVIVTRSARDKGEAELVRLKVDVIVTSPGPPAQQSLADVGRAQAKGLADVIKGKKGIVVIWNEDPFLRLTK